MADDQQLEKGNELECIEIVGTQYPNGKCNLVKHPDGSLEAIVLTNIKVTSSKLHPADPSLNNHHASLFLDREVFPTLWNLFRGEDIKNYSLNSYWSELANITRIFGIKKNGSVREVKLLFQNIPDSEQADLLADRKVMLGHIKPPILSVFRVSCSAIYQEEVNDDAEKYIYGAILGIITYGDERFRLQIRRIGNIVKRDNPISKLNNDLGKRIAFWDEVHKVLSMYRGGLPGQNS